MDCNDETPLALPDGLLRASMWREQARRWLADHHLRRTCRYKTTHGVVGEVGLGGIALGNEGLGLAFVDFQRELLKLHDAGVILVGTSKNNSNDALEVFDRHPQMVLRREHFAAMRIDWRDKVTSLLEISKELNLGIESFVFIDDSPVERDWVRRALPQVLVPELPGDPADRPHFLRYAGFFCRSAVSAADRERTASYKAQEQRAQLLTAARSFEDFLESLEQEAVVEPVHQGTAFRAAQLSQRTNQFNLTTRRYQTPEIEAIISATDREALTLSVRDRFGDSGITGLAVIRHRADVVHIDAFLMSCRMLGRKIEDAFLGALASRAGELGARYLVGEYIPSAKNDQVADFYASRGFEDLGEGRFRLDLTGHRLHPVPYIRIKRASHAT